MCRSLHDASIKQIYLCKYMLYFLTDAHQFYSSAKQVCRVKLAVFLNECQIRTTYSTDMFIRTFVFKNITYIFIIEQQKLKAYSQIIPFWGNLGNSCFKFGAIREICVSNLGQFKFSVRQRISKIVNNSQINL